MSPPSPHSTHYTHTHYTHIHTHTYTHTHIPHFSWVSAGVDSVLRLVSWSTCRQAIPLWTTSFIQLNSSASFPFTQWTNSHSWQCWLFNLYTRWCWLFYLYTRWWVRMREKSITVNHSDTKCSYIFVGPFTSVSLCQLMEHSLSW